MAAQRLLLEGDKPVRLGSRAFDILAALVERPGEVVGKKQLIARAWPQMFVEESNLKIQMSALRRTLGDGQGGNRYVITVPARNLTFWSGSGARLQAVFGIKGGDPDTALTRSMSTTSAASFTVELAEAFTRAGRIAEGLAEIEAGFDQSEAGWIAPELFRLRGELLLSQDAPAAPQAVESLFRQALNEASRQQALAWELRAATSLGRLLRDTDRPIEAIACLQPIYDRFTEGFDTADLIAAKHLLNELDA